MFYINFNTLELFFSVSVFFPGFCLAGHVLGASAVLLCLPSLILRAGRERLGVKGDEKEGLFRCSSLRKTRWKISSFTLRWKCRSLSDRQNQINCQVFFSFFLSLFLLNERNKGTNCFFIFSQSVISDFVLSRLPLRVALTVIVLIQFASSSSSSAICHITVFLLEKNTY